MTPAQLLRQLADKSDALWHVMARAETPDDYMHARRAYVAMRRRYVRACSAFGL